MISREDVQYIDKSYIASMEKFDELRERTERAIKTNEDARADISRWRDDVRDMVQRVRSKYMTFVDDFARQLK